MTILLGRFREHFFEKPEFVTEENAKDSFSFKSF